MLNLRHLLQPIYLKSFENGGLHSQAALIVNPSIETILKYFSSFRFF